MRGKDTGSASHSQGLAEQSVRDDANTDKPTAKRRPHFHGHRERMRAKFKQVGPSAFAEYELLEMLLYRSFRQGDTKPLAKQLIEEFGTLSEVLSAPVSRLTQVSGLGEQSALDLKLIQAAGMSLAAGHIRERALLNSWTKVLEYCRASMAFAEKEMFRILFLDKKTS